MPPYGTPDERGEQAAGLSEQAAEHNGRFEKLSPEVHDDLADWLAHTCDAPTDANSDGSGYAEAATESGAEDGDATGSSQGGEETAADGAHGIGHAGPTETERKGQSHSTGNLYLVRCLKSKDGEVTDLLRDDTGNRFVRKRFPRHDRSLRETYRALVSMCSAYLPRVYSVTETPVGIEVVRAYVTGPTLRDWVAAHGPAADMQARSLLAQVAAGVRQLHACRPPIIHRDLNPNNVVMGPAGPQIIDFGIARPFDPGADRDTHTWGTHGYAAPEQFGFGQSDVRTDVFALGMLYWFLLTGTDPDANLHARLSQMAPDDQLARSIPADACAIIAECVAIAPERRFANVDALTTALHVPQTAPEGAAATTRSATETPSVTLGKQEERRVRSVPDKPAQAAGSAGNVRPDSCPSHEQSTATATDAAERDEPEPAGPGTNGNAASRDHVQERYGNRANPSTAPRTAPRPQSQASRRHHRKSARATRRFRHSPARTVPGKVWFIASSAFMALMTAGAIAFVCEPWRFTYPEALARAIIACIGMLLFFGAPWLVTANPFGFRDRMPWLRTHTLRRCILFAAGGLVIGTAIVAIVSSGLSPEYVQVMQQNGSSSV